MPARVEGFVPGRLKMAREARLLRQTELAERIDWSESAISKWENPNSTQSPEPAAIPVLAKVLNVEPTWFFKPVERAGRAAFFRSLKRSLGQLRDKAEARLGFVEAIEETLSDYVHMLDVDIPDLMDGRDFRTLRLPDIQRIADDLRDYWDLGDGPIDDLLLLIENAGIIVAEDNVGSADLDGVSRWSEESQRPYMLLARDKNVGVRRRFDAAHELGHIVLHRQVSSIDLIENFALIEEQAMAFAGAFLLPEQSFSDDLFSNSLEAMIRIKEKWKVSVAAMIMRLRAIERVTPEYERRLWQYYSYRRWRGGEPFDDVLPVESPVNLKASIEMIVGEGGIRRSELLRDIGLSAADVETLAGLDEGFFGPSDANVIRLEPRLKTRTEDIAGPGGRVLPLRPGAKN